ncbi:MAG: hypothetical protein CME31_24770 [Gimesia sp.]|jgi:hypothetical protein|nr:hypothetical protein [Gimesia sp.]|tara:strand:+ start:576 stop:803 length:228 start_codon:yes stop_codon:yes gene_type:complete
MGIRNTLKVKSRRRPESVRAEGVNLETKTVKKDIEKNIKIEEDRISLKGFAVISAWNSYTNESWIRRLLNKIRRK